MKIDRTKLKKSSTDVPADCKALIERLKNCSEEELYNELTNIKTWTYGKCELYHWVDILDKFDEILEKACQSHSSSKWTFACDVAGYEKLKDLLLQVLQFTALLIEHSFSRHLYNSTEYLTILLSSCDMTVVLAVLNLLYVFGKRSNFITRLSIEKKQTLISRLTHLAESWGGKENGFGLADCCKNIPVSNFSPSATTLHFEFYAENKDDKGGKKGSANVVTCIHMESVDKCGKMPSDIMEELINSFNIPEDRQMLLYTHIRLAYLFSKYEARIQCVQARLQALSVLVYSNAIQDNMNALLYPGLIEELVDIVELNDMDIVDIKAAALRTLTSIIHLERNPKLNAIIDATGASLYHGFLPVLVRNCIQRMIDPNMTPFPQLFATALFSFLYHLASYESGGEALVSCGMMESLLKVINWYGEGQEHITFVTRAVRVVDLITNMDMAAFQGHGGLNAFLNRLEHEVNVCRKEQPFVIRPAKSHDNSMDVNPESPSAMETDNIRQVDSIEASTSGTASPKVDIQELKVGKPGVQCFPQRAALLKSMLNFLKKAIPDSSFSESIRHLMDGSLPQSLKHIISNAEYYGPSLFLLATDVVTVFVFQEPSLLSSLQDNGLTDVVLHALLTKDVPATREVLASLPNVFSALCLNARGLEAFVQCRPFDRLFKVLLSQDYLPAMRRRRSSDPFGDTASNLGNAMDELMRHQPSLRTDATKATIKLLEEVCAMGQDLKYICQKPQPKAEQSQNASPRSPQPPDGGGSSDEDDEDDDMASTASQSSGAKQLLATEQQAQNSQERLAIPLMDYILNVMKFVEAILSNNTTDDHCREFVTQNGLYPLMGILGLPNLPIDFPTSPACQAVASVCKAILTLSREPQVLKKGLLRLNEVLESLENLHKPLPRPGGSLLLRELALASHIPDAIYCPQATPLLHSLSAAHAYVMMFAHVCRMGQSDIRTISVSHWGSELGLQVLTGLSRLYCSLVWESTVLLALCTEDMLPADCEFGRADLEKLMPKDLKTDKDDKSSSENGTSTGSSAISASGLKHSSDEMGSNGVSAALESLTTSENQETPMETNEVNGSEKEVKKSKLCPTLQAQVKQLKPLLSVTSRLGRALAELFSLLVKLCVGTPVRQRRNHQMPATPTNPTPAAQAVAKALMKLLANAFSWLPPPSSPVPKLRLTFLVCCVGFLSPMLFDDKKSPYHLMLQKFLSSGAQAAFFDSFNWALTMGGKCPASEGLEHPDLPEGTGEFLDAWLMLVEKMVNPKTVTESPHVLPAKSSQPGFVPFSPVQYLITTQKAAFNAVMNLWRRKPLKTYGSRMSESMLAILCHIIKGESVIKEQLAKEKEAAENAAAGSSGNGKSRREEPEVNQNHLQQLIDMGFSREHAMESLLHTVTLEQATDYILTHMPPAMSSSQSQDLEMSEEDQMMRAIAMSLGENVVMSTDQDENQKKDDKLDDSEENQHKEDPLDPSVLADFSANALPGCLSLLDKLPETVYRICDLVLVVSQYAGNELRKKMLETLTNEIFQLGKQISQDVRSAASRKCEDVKLVLESPKTTAFGARLHLLSLLCEEVMIPTARVIQESNIIWLLVEVLEETQEYLCCSKEAVSLKWMAPLLLLLDLYEKVAVISKRKAEAEILLANCHTWKWFDDRSGRWCNYSVSNNKTIDVAYRRGESSVKFQAGRRRYTVHFNTMVQINEETGNRRPIMLALPGKEQPKEKTLTKGYSVEASGVCESLQESGINVAAVSATSSSTASVVSSSSSATGALTPPPPPPPPSTAEDAKPEIVVIVGLTEASRTKIIVSMVSMLSVQVGTNTLSAALRLILRLTREHKYAMMFSELGGPKLLLHLKQPLLFQGFTSLVTLIFRHILEEPSALKYSMEKVVKIASLGVGSGISGIAQGSPGAKEMHYVLRVLGPAACRSPEVFTSIAQQTLRIALPPPSKRDEDEARSTALTTPQMVKFVPTQSSSPAQVKRVVKQVVAELLNALILCQPQPQQSQPAATSEEEDAQAGHIDSNTQEITAELSSNSLSADQQQMEQNTVNLGPMPVPEVSDKDSSETSKDQKSNTEDQGLKPLLPKSAILRLLSEIVKSYTSCTQLITQHMYTAGQSEIITENCSVLAFVLDNLLSPCQTAGDRDCPALSRVLIASIASCNHCPEAQVQLAAEVKAALQRALNLPESSEKHVRLQALTGIISTMIESCPTPGQVPNQVFKGQQNLMNVMVKILIRRGLVTDLARVPHSLDLSSPYMASTINATLKPLETLSRIVNQPQALSAKSRSKNQGVGRDTSTFVETLANNVEGADSQQNSSTLELEDAATDQADIITESTVTTAASVESELQQSDGRVELDHVLDELLQRDSNRDPEQQVIGEIIMETGEEPLSVRANDDEESPDVIIDVDVEQEEMDRHDSQMISQESSEGEDADVTEDVHEEEGSEEESGSGDEEEGDECDNEDDEEHEDEEDEDEGSECMMEADDDDDDDDYQEADSSMAQAIDDDYLLHVEDVFPTGQHVVFNDNSSYRTYHLPFPLQEDNGNETSVPSLPPAPSSVPTTHPLLIRNAEPATVMGVTRVHRGNRQRGTYRFNPSTSTLQVNIHSANNRQPNPPVILQRLLGPATAADVLQLTSGQANFSSQTRVVLANEDLRLISRQDDDLFDELFQDNYPDNSSAGPGVLSCIPSTLTRWTEEAKVLDGDSVHDCVTVLKSQVIETLEKHRDTELEERREKRRKATEEENAQKAQAKAEEQKSDNTSTDEVNKKSEAQSASNMEVSTPNIHTSTSAESEESNKSNVTEGVQSSAMEAELSDQLCAWGPTAATTTDQPSSAVKSHFSTPTVTSSPICTPSVVGSSTSEGISSTSDGLNLLCTASRTLLADSMSTPLQPIPISTPRAPIASTRTQGNGGVGRRVTSSKNSNPEETPMEVMVTPESNSAGAAGGGSSVGIVSSDNANESVLSDSSAIRGTNGDESKDQQNASTNAPTEGGTSIDLSVSSNVTPDVLGTPSTIPLISQHFTPSDNVGSQSHQTSSEGLQSGDTSIPELTSALAGNNMNESLSMPTITSTPITESSNLTSAAAAGRPVDSALPEGVDPSFLAALPDNIRQEVIAEQLRLQRIQRRAQQQAQNSNNMGLLEVNPEFLAALPPAIQEEVLSQQRAEQARLNAQQNPSNPETPVDPANFFASLPSSLRQQVLADMDDSMVAVLPPDLAAEAQALRRELEERHRRLMQERFFAQTGAGSLSAILRQTGLAGRLGTRYAIRAAPRSGNQWCWSGNRPGQSNLSVNSVKLRGRQLLDHEALTCLLVLLFLDEPKINTNRLHRVFRNLCYHAPTRAWVVRALLSILQRTSNCTRFDNVEGEKGKGEKSRKRSQSMQTDNMAALKVDTKNQASWLSISLEAALGCRTNVFQIQRSGKKHPNLANSTVTIHHQAAPVVCRHVLDSLISLAKSFPSQFLPSRKAKEASKCDTDKDKDGKDKEDGDKGKTEGTPSSPRVKEKQETTGSTGGGVSSSISKQDSDFWDLLVRLDSLTSRKGKGLQRLHSTSGVDIETFTITDFESAPIGQLMGMLSHPVIHSSQMLTDRLLRLLGLVSIGLPDLMAQKPQDASSSGNSTTSVSVSTGTTPSATSAVSLSVAGAPALAGTPPITSGLTISATTTTTNTGTPGQPLTLTSALNESTPKPADSWSEENAEKTETDDQLDSWKNTPILETQLQLAVKVLTSKSCSEEGLEDATNLLLQLSRANASTHNAVLKLLLDGAQELGHTICEHIRKLLVEIRELNSKLKELQGDEPKDTSPLVKGYLTDRFTRAVNVVVSAPTKMKGGHDLQLPSMSMLTSKNSSQQFFLRILKVIIQLRDAARHSLAKKSRTSSGRSLTDDVLVPALEAEVEASSSGAVSGALFSSTTSSQDGVTVTPHSSGIAGTGPTIDANSASTSSSQELNSNSTSVESQPTSQSIMQQQSFIDSVISMTDSQMDVDQADVLDDRKVRMRREGELPRLSDHLQLDDMWTTLGDCLTELAKTPDHHAVLILQPAVEAFFLVHAGEKDPKKADNQAQKREDQLAHLNVDVAPASPSPAPNMESSALLTRENSLASVSSLGHISSDTQKFLKFAETHRTVLNQILRQSTTPLADGPFSVLVDHTRVLDFDVKRRYFRQELERLDEGLRREDLAVHVKREHVFEDSFRELFRRSPEEWKHRFYIVFEGEEGQDAGGLLREWYVIISREIFNPMYALFRTSPGDRVTYTINPSSHCNSNHLSYFKFVGRIIAKAIYDNKLLECYFTRSFYKHIIGQPVKYTDMESEDYSFYQGLVFLLENDVKDLGYELTFSTEIQEFGVTEARDLKPDGRNLTVTEENKKEYVKIVCQMRMTGAIRKQLNAFLEGFYDIIPKRLISIFNEQELELLISGLPNIDIDDLKANSEYHKYQPNSLQIQWFWRALRSFDQADRARFIQFVTGTSKVPLQGFAFLEGMNGIQKFQIHRDDRSTDRLPTAHTCFNQLDLPAYETYDKLRHMLLLAINECSEGFGLA